MSKKRSQAEIALEQHLRNKRLGIKPTLRGQKRPLRNEILIKIDESVNKDNCRQDPCWEVEPRQDND